MHLLGGSETKDESEDKGMSLEDICKPRVRRQRITAQSSAYSAGTILEGVEEVDETSDDASAAGREDNGDYSTLKGALDMIMQPSSSQGGAGRRQSHRPSDAGEALGEHSRLHTWPCIQSTANLQYKASVVSFC